jgi:hypothetical protein
VVVENHCLEGKLTFGDPFLESGVSLNIVGKISWSRCVRTSHCRTTSQFTSRSSCRSTRPSTPASGTPTLKVHPRGKGEAYEVNKHDRFTLEGERWDETGGLQWCCALDTSVSC